MESRSRMFRNAMIMAREAKAYREHAKEQMKTERQETGTKLAKVGDKPFTGMKKKEEKGSSR